MPALTPSEELLPCLILPKGNAASPANGKGDRTCFVSSFQIPGPVDSLPHQFRHPRGFGDMLPVIHAMAQQASPSSS